MLPCQLLVSIGATSKQLRATSTARCEPDSSIVPQQRASPGEGGRTRLLTQEGEAPGIRRLPDALTLLQVFAATNSKPNNFLWGRVGRLPSSTLFLLAIRFSPRPAPALQTLSRIPVTKMVHLGKRKALFCHRRVPHRFALIGNPANPMGVGVGTGWDIGVLAPREIPPIPDLGHLAPVFLTLHIIGGQIILPILVATCICSKTVMRHPTLINFLSTWIIHSVCSCLL